jgi:altronate dehydratase
VVFAAAGAQLILLVAARETPFASPVPAARISPAAGGENARPKYADFGAGSILTGESLDDAAERLEEYAIRVACGEKVSRERRVIRKDAG